MNYQDPKMRIFETQRAIALFNITASFHAFNNCTIEDHELRTEINEELNKLFAKEKELNFAEEDEQE